MERMSEILLPKKTNKLDFIICWRKYNCILRLFGIEYIPQEVLSKIKHKLITYNIFRIQFNDYKKMAE